MSGGTVNRVILVGNIGKDPEVHFYRERSAKISFPLATNDSYRDKSGDWHTDTEWHNIVLFRNDLTEQAEGYLRKMTRGTKVYVEGKLKTRNWQDQQGNTRYITEIMADSFTVLDKPTHDQTPTADPVKEEFARLVDAHSDTKERPQ
jgi:single-strand DNA-binding protein